MSNDSKVTSLGDEAAASPAQNKPATRVVQSRASSHDVKLSGKRRTIEIYASEAEGGDNAVEIGLNGVLFLIPRATPCDVPEEVEEVLRNAVTTVTSPAKAGGGVTEREVPRYNYRVLA